VASFVEATCTSNIMPKPFIKRRGKKREIVFDPEARKEYLRGFSERKRQRRAYGLAMQRVKDRKAKIDQRKQEKKDDLNRIEEAERQKEELLEEAMLNNAGTSKDADCDSDDEATDEEENKNDISKVFERKTYDDKQTENQWGGRVVVTTSEVALGDDSDDDDNNDDAKKRKKSVDAEQRYAGNVEKYLNELKGKMPGKKRDQRHHKRKGKNGAAEMKGVGGAGNLKIAQKLLTKTKAQQKSGAGHQKKKKGRKSRR